jgi:molybdopterin-guanine dinucleotide biosynthesis protein A
MRGFGYDAVVLSGGRGSRLGGIAKARMLTQADDAPVSLLQRAVSAAGDAQRIVVVGDGVSGLPPTVRVVRETPAFGGPAAALGAGVRELGLDGRQQELVLVLACDMPSVGRAVGDLLAAASSDPDHDGVVAIDPTGHAQYLAAVYRLTALRSAVNRSRDVGIEGMSMRVLLAGLQLTELAVARGVTDDVDDWEDAARMGVFVAPADRNGEDQTWQTRT